MSSSMDWVEVSPGQFERPTDSLEKFFVAVGNLGAPVGQEHMTLSFGVKIHASFDNLEAALRQTWASLRYEHPNLAVLRDGDKLVYHAATPELVESWLKETFIVKDGLTAAELAPSLCAPTTLSRLFFLPKSSEVVISTSHWRIDGMGAIQLLSLLLKRLAEPTGSPEWGKEVSRLTRSLDHILSLPSALSEAADAKQNGYLMEVGSKMPSISLAPAVQPPAVSGETGREEMTFSKSLTSAIVAGCKEMGFGPTAGLQAALIAATRALQGPDDKATNYVSMGAFSLRDYLPADVDKSDYSVGIYHTGIPYAIKPSGSFKTDALAMHEFYRNAMKDQDTVQGLQVLHNKLAYTMSQVPPEGTPPVADPAISSLGIIDRYIDESYDGAGGRKFDVTDFWIGAPINTYNIWIHLWTFRGHMTLSTLHNRGIYSQEQIKSWLADIKRIMCEELNIKDE